MTEAIPYPVQQPIPREDYPTLFSGEVPPGFEAQHERNRQFAATLIPPTTEEGYSEFDQQVVELCAAALTDTDHRLGRNVGELGKQAALDENGWQDGLWNTLATFYHNGDGTRLAMIGTKQYMDFVNERDGEQSPYRDRRVYLASMVAASFDDVVFGAYGRGNDELTSAAIAEDRLRAIGAPEDFIEAVSIAIKASIFDEVHKKQRYNPALGAELFDGIGSEPVQRASLIGDLWALGKAQSSVNSFLLMFEHLWKRDSGLDQSLSKAKQDRYQVLRKVAVIEYFANDNGWHPRELNDFLELVERYPEAKKAVAAELIDNKVFLRKIHKYAESGDPRVDELMWPAKVQNSNLQKHVGIALRDKKMNVWQAFHCLLSYAALQPGYRRRGEPAALPLAITPDQISEILLRPNPLSATAPREVVNATSFFRRYKAEMNIGRLATGS